jgi:hypothetical protein
MVGLLTGWMRGRKRESRNGKKKGKMYDVNDRLKQKGK